MAKVIISINKKYVDLINCGLKYWEIRKSALKEGNECFIYETKNKGGCGKVVAKFTSGRAAEFSTTELSKISGRPEMEKTLIKHTGLSYEELLAYSNRKTLYFNFIDELQVFDEPKELSEFGLKRPPQSWQYLK